MRRKRSYLKTMTSPNEQIKKLARKKICTCKTYPEGIDFEGCDLHESEVYKLRRFLKEEQSDNWKQHKWSGWPGAYCQECFIDDPLEQAVAKESTRKAIKEIEAKHEMILFNQEDFNIIMHQITQAHKAGRREGIEEAAKVANSLNIESWESPEMARRDITQSIRQLLKGEK